MTDPRPQSEQRGAGPILWLVAGIPLLTIVAGVGTVLIASRTGSSDAVIDPVTRTAQVQDRDLRGDRLAAQLGLSASGTIAPGSGAVSVRLAGLPTLPSRLTLTVGHPTRRSGDARVELVAGADGSHLGRTGIELDHDWNLLLAADDAGWRLVGRLPAHTGTFDLVPALAAD